MVILEEIDQRFFNSTAEAQNYIKNALSMGTRSIFRIVNKDVDDENDGTNVEKTKCQKLAIQIVDGLENDQNVNDLTLKLCYLVLKEGK